MKKLLLPILCLALFFASCKKEDDDNTEKIPYSSLSSTTNYYTTFSDAAGNTTVEIEDANILRAMLKEMDSYLRTATTATLDANKLNNYFANTNSPFANSDLNSKTTYSLVANTAASFSSSDAEVERNRFRSFFTSLAALSAQNGNTASAGQPGILLNGTSKYLVNEKGWEYSQFIQKGMMGAMMMDQISNVYLGSEKQNADNNSVVTGTNYTALQHNWDKAFGFLTANEIYPKPDTTTAGKFLESFLGDYIRQVDETGNSTNVSGNPRNVFVAFLTGRAAIENKDLTKRNEQIKSINSAMEKAVAQVAVSYLNKSKTATTDGSRFHAMSEATGFIYSLRYAGNAKVNAQKSDELMNKLMNKAPNGFWSLSSTDVDAVRDEIASLIGISKDALVNH